MLVLAFSAGVVAASLFYASTYYGDYLFNKETEELVQRLLKDESNEEEAQHHEDASDSTLDPNLFLPQPIARYLTFAIPESVRHAHNVPSHAFVHQAGLIAMGPGAWSKFKTVKVVALPPKLKRGYVWTCTLSFWGVRIYIRDSLVEGKGKSYGSIFGLFSMGRFYGEPLVNLSSIMRYLAESVWSPQAFLPRFGCSWTASGTINGLPAFEASIKDRASTEPARTVFTFDPESGLPKDMLIPSRPKMVGKQMIPADMGGVCSDPVDFGGFVIPSYQEAWWVEKDGGKLEMWKARIVGVDWHYD